MSNLGAVTRDILHILAATAISFLATVALCVLFLLVFFVWVFSGSSSVDVYVHPSPDRKAALLVQVTLAGGATVGAAYDIYLVRGAFKPKTDLGAFFDQGWAGGRVWTGVDTLNICDPAAELEIQPGATRSYDVLDAKGRKSTYRVTNRCEPPATDPRQAPAS